jgi:citrate lyase beta subunit
MNDKLGKGSYSLDGKMIDAPVYKQVSDTSLMIGVKRGEEVDMLGIEGSHQS